MKILPTNYAHKLQSSPPSRQNKCVNNCWESKNFPLRDIVNDSHPQLFFSLTDYQQTAVKRTQHRPVLCAKYN